MFGYFRSLFFTDTGKDTLVVLTGTIINAAIGGAFFILAPRILGPQDYGLFAVVMSTGIMVANLANLGIDTGILRFINQENQKSRRILKLALEAYLWIGLATIIFGFLLAKPLANILGNSSLTPLLRIAFSGVIFILITDFFVAALQTRKQFINASLVNIVSNVARLSILAFAAYFFTVDVYFLTFLFFFITVVSAVVGKLFVPFDFLKTQGHYQEFKKFFAFNSWIAASLAISSIPIDNYLLVKLAGPIATGIYAAPFKILSIVDQLSGNFSRVLAPRLTSFDSHKKAIDFTKKTIPIVLIVSIPFILAALAAQPIVKLLLGDQYLPSAVIFRIIAIGSVFTFATSIPVSLIVYYFGQSKITFFITSILVLLWASLNRLLIPEYQEIGAAWAYFAAEFAAFALFSLYVIWKFLKKENGSS